MLALCEEVIHSFLIDVVLIINVVSFLQLQYDFMCVKTVSSVKHRVFHVNDWKNKLDVDFSNLISFFHAINGKCFFVQICTFCIVIPGTFWFASEIAIQFFL